jgi:hypothetical protein
MLSFAYPAQAHVNHSHLLTILKHCGPTKSLRTLLTSHEHTVPTEHLSALNRIQNNWHDLEFNRRIVLDPMRIKEVAQNTFFDSIGHSLHLGLAYTLWLLISTFDSECSYFPDIRKWESGFEELRQARVEGFYYGSPVGLLPIGALHIFEGQARFSQLQFLYMASDEKLDWGDFERMGMLGDDYVTAFKRFLEWSNLPWPSTPIAPIVQLFLLVCDLAVNPSDGYPFDICHFESFIYSNDPGRRFFWFARHIAKNNALRDSVARCTREEYLEVGNILVKTLACCQPVEICEKITQLATDSPRMRELLEEDTRFDYSDENLPVRLCFARHLRIAKDRIRRPEFFCWPGMYFVSGDGDSVDLDDSYSLWQRHKAMFMRAQDGVIKPALLDGISESVLYDVFNSFYGWLNTYDMIRQWTAFDGPFKYETDGIPAQYSRDDVKKWSDGKFIHVFGVSPDAFRCF